MAERRGEETEVRERQKWTKRGGREERREGGSEGGREGAREGGMERG